MRDRRRVLVTPREIAGAAAGLQHVLGRRGHIVDVLLRWSHPFAYALEPWPTWVMRRVAATIVEHDHGRYPRLKRALSLLARVALLPVIAARYDAVVFIGPDTLLRGGWDRRLLRRLGVTTISVFCGSDSRPPYLDGWYAGAGATASMRDARVAVSAAARRVALAERDSCYVVNHAGGAQFHRRPFVDWTVLGFAQRAPQSAAPPGPPGPAGEALRVLHAPSDPRMKGTAVIRSTVEQLRREGVAIDYTEVSGRPHAEVQLLLQEADLVIDQLYSDAVLPGLASEAARMGTAVVVCGYADALIADAARRTGAPTGHYAHPAELLSRLRLLLTDAQHRASIGSALQQFVTSGHWSADAIGARWERLINRDADAAWFTEPKAVVYIHGCAVEADEQAAYLREYVAAYGVEGLEAAHHPTLQAALRSAAGR